MTEKKIITIEQANRNIEFVLYTHSIKMTKDFYGFLRSTEEEIAYVFSKANWNIEESMKEKCDVFELSFTCGTRQIREYEPEEMIREARRMMSYAEATKELNELFENVLVKKGAYNV